MKPEQNSYYRGQKITLDLNEEIAGEYTKDLEWSIANRNNLKRFMDDTAIDALLKVDKNSKIATLTIPPDLREEVKQIAVKVENKLDKDNPNPPSAFFVRDSNYFVPASQ